MSNDYLVVKDLCRNFGGLAAVKDLNFSVAKGEIVGLIGSNGAGKTTAFNVISGTLAPSSGSVVFNGRDITGKPPSQVVAAGLGRTFQSTSTYPDASVAENIYRGLLSRIEGSAVRRLMGRSAGLIPASSLEQEIDEILGIVDMRKWRDTPAGSLAYGLQKKLGIAAALASRPTMLLMDEPAAGLNHEECNELTNLLRKLQQQYGMTLLLVEHHMAIVMALCERIFVLAHGQKIAQGTPGEIRENPAVIEAYLGAPDYAHA